jgi:hypothetical protein
VIFVVVDEGKSSGKGNEPCTARRLEVRHVVFQISRHGSRLWVVPKKPTLVVFLLMSTTVPQLEPASESNDQASQQTKEQ